MRHQTSKAMKTADFRGWWVLTKRPKSGEKGIGAFLKLTAEYPTSFAAYVEQMRRLV